MHVGFAVGLVMLSAAPVFGTPRVAVHPLVVNGGDARAIDQSKADFILEAAQQPIQMVSRGQVAEVLEAGGCTMTSEGCLEKLCRDTGATYALLTSLELNGPAFVLQAK